jgi:predicted DNA repair protein MutK
MRPSRRLCHRIHARSRTADHLADRQGRLKNKLLILLPAALRWRAFLPQALTPLLMLGGAFLCFEAPRR